MDNMVIETTLWDQMAYNGRISKKLFEELMPKLLAESRRRGLEEGLTEAINAIDREVAYQAHCIRHDHKSNHLGAVKDYLKVCLRGSALKESE